MSLLLDALKKAAQEKLEKKSPDAENAEGGTEIDDATEVESPPAQTQLEAETEISVDPTEAEAAETKLEKFDLNQAKQNEQQHTESATEVDSAADLTMTEFEGVATEVAAAPKHTADKSHDSSSARRDSEATHLDTKIETPPAEAEPKAETELELAPLENETFSEEEEDLNFEIESTTQYNRHRANVLASELQEFLNPDNTQNPVGTSPEGPKQHATAFGLATETETEDATQFGYSADEDVSMTQNWSEQQSNYIASPQHAQQLFTNKALVNSQKKRMLALLTLLFIAFVFIAGIYGYSYFTTLNDNSVVINRPARPSLPAAPPQQQAAVTESDEAVDVDPALLIEQEDYSSILEENLNDKIERPASVSAVEKTVSARRNGRNAALKEQQANDRQQAVATQQGELSIRKTQPTERLEDIIMQGYTAYQNGNLEASKTAYQKALRLSASNRDTLLGLAAIATIEGDSAQARQYYEQLLKINPKDDLAIAGLAASANDNTAVINDDEESRIKLLLKEMPNSAQLHFTLGNFFAQKKRWPDAQQAYFDAFRLQADNPDYAFNLAVSLDHLGQQSSARRFYREALKLAKTQPANFDNQAVAARVAALQTE